MSKKRVGIQLPKQAQNQTVEQRYSLELEGLAAVADIGGFTACNATAHP